MHILSLLLYPVFTFFPLGDKGKTDIPLTIQRINKQHHFDKQIPAGNYSGITYLGDNLYAVVSDKSPHDGFFVFKITLNPLTADIVDIRNLGFRGSDITGGDIEAIAYVPSSNMLYITRESDNTIKEYTLEGKITNRQLPTPFVYQRARDNLGLESLTHNAHTHRFWLCNESTLAGDGEQANAVNGIQNQLRLQSLTTDFIPLHQYAYLMDKPHSTTKANLYDMGVVDVTALDDGSLLVLEREFHIPHSKLGAYVINKIYRVIPEESRRIDETEPLTAQSSYLTKHFVAEWKTRLSIFHQDIANYEAMCLGPRLADGSQVLVLVSDSQNQAGGVLKDWFKTIVVR